MKLTEVKNERTFNLEISESDLRLLFGAANFKIGPGEYVKSAAGVVVEDLANSMDELYVEPVLRSDVINA